jgi:two-component system, cell cycle sensor histidine kinase and response regulator CckA
MKQVDLLKELESLRHRVAELEDTQSRLTSMEEALRESEERFRLLYENAPLGYQSLDENGYFVEVNRAWLETLGYSRQEVIGKWFGDFLAPEFVDSFRCNFPKFKAAGEIHWVEFDMLKQDGSRVSVAFDGQIGRDRWGRFKQTHCILHDVTELKRSHDALRKSEERYRRIVETANEGIWAMDADHLTTFVNQRIVDMLGYSAAEMLGRKADLFMWEEDLNDHETKMRVQSRGGAESYERRFRRKDGETVWTVVSATAFEDDEGRFAGSFAMLTDITDRKTMEVALRKNQEQLQAIFETSPAAIFLVSPEGRITFANQRMADLFSLQVEDLPGTPYVELILPEQRSVGYGKMKDLMSGQIDRVNLERRYIKADGSEFLGHLSGRRLKRPDGGLDGLVGIIEDITERKKAEEELRRSEERFRSLIDQAPDAVFVHDFNGRFLEVNQQASNALGYTRDELISMCVRDIDPNALARGDSATFWANLPATFEATHRRRDGTLFPVEMRLGPIEYGDTKVVLAVARDISERNVAEKNRRESENRYRSLVDASPDPILMYDLKGNLITVNQQAAIAYGVDSTEQLLAEVKNVIQILDGESKEKAVENLKRTFLAESSRKTEYTVVRKDGSALEVEINSSTFRSAEDEPLGFISVVRDITDRKRAEAEVNKSKGMISSILNSVPQSIFWKDRDSRYLGCNKVFARAVGLESPDQIVGKTDFELPWPSEEAEAYRDDDHDVTVNNKVKRHIVEPLQQADGTRLWIDTTKVPLVDENGSVYGVLGVSDDITARKQAEEERSLNTQRLEALVQLGRMSDAPLDELAAFAMEEAVRLTESSIGYVAFANEDESVLTMHAWSQEAMRQCAIDEKPSTYPVDHTGLWGEAIRQRRPMITNDYAAPSPWKKGTPEGHVRVSRHMNVPIFDQGRVVVVAGVGNKLSGYDDNDIRQLTLLMEGMWGIVRRRKADQRLKLLGASLEQAGESILITDPVGATLYANPAFTETNGYSLDEALGKTPALLKKSKHTEAFSEDMWSAIKRGEVWRGRFTNRRKDGSLYEETATISPIKDTDGHIVNFVIVGRNVTTEVMLQKQLLQAQKMEAIGTLAGGIAHDFNNLLQAILGYADLLLMRKEPGDPDRQRIAIIRRAAQDGADLVSRILTFSRKAEAKTRPIDLNEEMRRAERLLRRMVPKMVEITLVLADDLRIVDANAAQIEQILLNLAVNAQHAMPDGGQLSIETRNESFSAESLGGSPNGKTSEYVLLTVSDTGAGMEADVLERMFEPFFTTKTDGQGTGLGLSMVHGIVTQHGGHITCYSKPGKGTSFKIYFPVAQSEWRSESDDTQEMPGFGTEVVLLVDDDERVRDMTEEMIREHGYQVLAARSGQEALEIYALHKDKVALVILDLIMHGMGGKECLKELLKIDPRCKVLIASGFSEDASRKECMELGAKGFVAKPFRFKELLQQIRRALDE